MTDRSFASCSVRSMDQCDAAFAKVRYNNFAALEKRMGRAFDAIIKLGKSNHCEVVQRYSQLKLDELRCAHEYDEKLPGGKGRAAADSGTVARGRARRREIEKAQQEAEKEEARYDAALD